MSTGIRSGLIGRAFIFETFLEPIGNSTYGSLWADTVTNPSFEENLWSVRRIAEMIKEEPALARSSSIAPLPWCYLCSSVAFSFCAEN